MALVVENGTGLANAESYSSVSDLDTYITNYNITSTADTAAKEAALRIATDFIDGAYRFPGIAKDDDQALRWPRVDAFTDEGYDILSSEIPDPVKDATVVAAMEYLTNGEFDLTDADGNIVRKRTKVDVIETEVEYSGSKSTSRHFPKVDRLLAKVGGVRKRSTVRLVRS